MAIKAVKSASAVGEAMGATGTSSTERPAPHNLSRTLLEFFGSVGVAAPKS
jgi:hypothetical protein